MPMRCPSSKLVCSLLLLRLHTIFSLHTTYSYLPIIHTLTLNLFMSPQPQARGGRGGGGADLPFELGRHDGGRETQVH